jgi:hypothetical protein
MNVRSTRANLLRSAMGIGACLLFGWFAFVRGTRVPILGGVDLGFHELGHLLTYPLPDIVTATMGSVVQIAVPVGLAVYFLLARRDLLGAGACFAWAATSAVDVSVYIADAPYERLPLIGGYHDWAFILGPEHLDVLTAAHTLATVVKGLGFVLLLTGFACCVSDLAPSVRALRAQPPAPSPTDAYKMWR